MTSVRYTADRLMAAAGMMVNGTLSERVRVMHQVDGEELLRFGSAWQEEVRQLRERIAEMSAELYTLRSKEAE